LLTLPANFVSHSESQQLATSRGENYSVNGGFPTEGVPSTPSSGTTGYYLNDSQANSTEGPGNYRDAEAASQMYLTAPGMANATSFASMPYSTPILQREDFSPQNFRSPGSSGQNQGPHLVPPVRRLPFGARSSSEMNNTSPISTPVRDSAFELGHFSGLSNPVTATESMRSSNHSYDRTYGCSMAPDWNTTYQISQHQNQPQSLLFQHSSSNGGTQNSLSVDQTSTLSNVYRNKLAYAIESIPPSWNPMDLFSPRPVDDGILNRESQVAALRGLIAKSLADPRFITLCQDVESAMKQV